MFGLQLFSSIIFIHLLIIATGFSYGQPILPKERRFGDWLMIFRGQSGNNKSIVHTYMTPSVASERDRTTHDACLSLNGTTVCTEHYRHSIIDRWGSANVKQVKVELYSKGQHVAHVIFNAEDTTSTSWFDKSRIISSSWLDIKTSSANYFDFFGDAVLSSFRHRRMLMQKSYGGCSKDRGWMVVVESEGPCSKWESKNDKYPTFRYSADSVSSLTENYRKAEVLAIYAML